MYSKMLRSLSFTSIPATHPPHFRRPNAARSFCCSCVLSKTALPPRLSIPESSITESFLKGTGPGGQKINKTSSAVQLKHLPTGLVVKCQATRSRTQNRKIARKLLAEKLDVMENGEMSREAIKREVIKKKKQSKAKKARRKYRKLEAEKEEHAHESGTEGNENGTSFLRESSLHHGGPGAPF